MAKASSKDYATTLTLLRAALGDFDPKKPLDKAVARLRDFGKFEWMLTIIGIEIDLRVDIPEALADDLSQTPERFCTLVANLPKVDSPGYTLECLGLVAQALLSLDLTTEFADATSTRTTARQTSKRDAKAPRKRATASPVRSVGGKQIPRKQALLAKPKAKVPRKQAVLAKPKPRRG